MSFAPEIVWLRDDLRLADNPALSAAAASGAPVLVVYLFDEASPGIRPLGGASRWWLHHSLESLRRSLEDIGGRLILRSGPAVEAITRLVEETDARAVHWNRRYTAARQVDAELKSRLREQGVEAISYQASLLFEPWTISTATGTPYRVFTPFWRACLAAPHPRPPLAAPTGLAFEASANIPSDRLDDWQLLPKHPEWAGGLAARWQPGEASALTTLEDFATDGLSDYGHRDEPARDSTSHLSPHLRFGEISPFQVWDRLHGLGGSDAFLRRIGWREFNWSILFHSPEIATRNLHEEFDAFPWQKPQPAELHAWQQGETGIPLVDAGMRELWATGYMHNRVRMVAASFLIKNLLIDWRIGEAWFWDTLVDADEANNPGNWQWVAGSGADAAPYFRVFNPVLQAKKFDGREEYIRRWIPDGELRPEPIVDLAQTRQAALAAYDVVRRAGGRQ